MLIHLINYIFTGNRKHYSCSSGNVSGSYNTGILCDSSECNFKNTFENFSPATCHNSA